jgi:hypothetical protein
MPRVAPLVLATRLGRWWLGGAGGGHTLKASCGQDRERGEAADDDAGALEQPAQADKPGTLAKARSSQCHCGQLVIAVLARAAKDTSAAALPAPEVGRIHRIET